MSSLHREHGQAVVLALFVLLLVTTGLSLLARGVLLEVNSVRQQGQRLQLQALCDAAMAETLALLDDRPAARGLTERQLGDGTYEAKVSVVRQRPQSTLVDVEVRGSLADRSLTAVARVRLRDEQRPEVLDWQSGQVRGR
ncbi:MAG: hypothetical protein AAGK22_13290 [Acidobacteriota bacterium]